MLRQNREAMAKYAENANFTIKNTRETAGVLSQKSINEENHADGSPPTIKNGMEIYQIKLNLGL